MEKVDLNIGDSFLIKSSKFEDLRGFFARGFCKSWIDGFEVDQMNWSYNLKRGTVRGFHFQIGDFREEKIITIARGAVDFYILDLNSASGKPNIRKVTMRAIESSSVANSEQFNFALKIGKRVAVAFQTLCDDTLVNYLMSASFNAESYRGINALDPLLGLRWSLPITVMSERDRTLPRYSEICG